MFRKYGVSFVSILSNKWQAMLAACNNLGSKGNGGGFGGSNSGGSFGSGNSGSNFGNGGNFNNRNNNRGNSGGNGGNSRCKYDCQNDGGCQVTILPGTNLFSGNTQG